VLAASRLFGPLDNSQAATQFSSRISCLFFIRVAFAGLTLLASSAQAAMLASANILLDCEQPEPVLVICDYKVAEQNQITGVTAMAGGTMLPVTMALDYPSSEQTTAILFLLDTSDPARGASVKRGTDHILAMLETMRPHHRLGLAKFDTDLTLLASIGSSKEELQNAAQTLRASGLTTELYRNTLQAVRLLASDSADRKAVFLLSDGLAEDLAYNHADVVQAANESGVEIYGVGYAKSTPLSVALQVLRRLAEETGGEFVNASKDTEELANFIQAPYARLDSGGQIEIDLSPLKGLVEQGEAEMEITFHSANTSSTMSQLISMPPPPEPVVEPAPEVEPPPIIPLEPQEVLEQEPLPRGTPTVVSSPGDALIKRQTWYVIAGVLLTLLLLTLLWMLLRRMSASRTGSAPYAYLWKVDGDDTQRYDISSAVTRIGRHKHNEVRLPNKTVSRFHAELGRNEFGHFKIIDRASKNGVRVGGRFVNSSALQEGDVICVGDVYLRFSYLPHDFSTFEDTELYGTSIVDEQRTRRSSLRKTVGVDVRIFHRDVGWVHGRLADLSVEGAFVHTDQKFPSPHTRIDVVIPIVTETVRRWYRFPAELVRQSDEGVGVVFRELNPASARWLEVATKAA